MSGAGRPFDGDRTVIRPAGRSENSEETPAPPRSPPPAGATVLAAAAAAPERTVWASAEATRWAPADRPAGADRGPARPSEATLPLDVALAAAQAAAFPSSNPLVAAAGPLLILLGHVRLNRVTVELDPLLAHCANALADFGAAVLAKGVSEDEKRLAQYALAATVDDVVFGLPGVDRQTAATRGMLMRFFDVRSADVGFYEELDKAVAQPDVRANLIELMDFCLQLGFQGRHRSGAGGAAALQGAAASAYQGLRSARPRPAPPLSVNWRPVQSKAGRFRVPLWATAGFAAAIVVGAFFLLRHLLASDAEALTGRLLALNPTAPLTIDRPAFQPYQAPPAPPPPAVEGRLDRLRTALADDIAGGTLTIEEAADVILLRIDNRLLFDPGKADLKADFAPVGARLAKALDGEAGPIAVVGHTDNAKPKAAGRFKSNHDLSLARATAVRDALAPALGDATRLSADGKGDLDPIADNGTAEGRARNRRVELLIAKQDPPG